MNITTLAQIIHTALADEGTVPTRKIDFRPDEIVMYCPSHKDTKLKKTRGTAKDRIKGRLVCTEFAFCPDCDYMVKRKPTDLPYDV